MQQKFKHKEQDVSERMNLKFFILKLLQWKWMFSLQKFMILL